MRRGDATQNHVLARAGVKRARGLAACLGSDADNLFLCLSARDLSRDLEIAARVENGESVPKMRQAGANHVILPTVTGATRLVAMLLRPAVVSFLDATTIADEFSLRLEELEIPQTSRLSGKTLAEARIPQETGLIVLAVRPRGREGPATFNPGPTTRLSTGDLIIVLGQPEQLERLRSYAA